MENLDLLLAKMFSDGTYNFSGIDLSKITPCTVINGELKPIADNDAARPGDAGNPIRPSLIPDGYAFTAVANVLERDNLSASGAVLYDGSRTVTLEYPSAGFTMDKLIKDFNTELSELFVFDDVRFSIVQKPGDAEDGKTVTMSCNLRMDSGPLLVFGTFMKQEKTMFLSGTINLGKQDLSGKIELSSLVLESPASFYIPVKSKIALNSITFKLQFEKTENAVPGSPKWTSRAFLTGSLDLTGLIGKRKTSLKCTVDKKDDTLQIAAEGAVENVFGITGFDLNSAKINFIIGREDDIELKAELVRGNRTLAFTGKITPGFSGMHASYPDFRPEDLNDLFNAVSRNSLALPEFGMSFSNAAIGLANGDGAVNDIMLKKGITVKCTVGVHGYTCPVTGIVSPDEITLMGSLGAIGIGPINLSDAKLEIRMFKSSDRKPAEFLISGRAEIARVQVDCKVFYEKLHDSYNTVVYSSPVDKTFRLSTVLPAAKNTPVDTIEFSKTVFIYSLEGTTARDPEFSFPVKKGLQLIGILEEIPLLTKLTGRKYKNLILSAHFGDPIDVGIEVPETALKLGRSVRCEPFRIVIDMANQPAFGLAFGMDVTVPRQETPLHFDLMLKLELLKAVGSGTMKNYWAEPFGLRGLKIGPELALQMGILYGSPVPSEFGFAGGLVLGDVTARMAFKISEDISREILYGKLDRLTPGNLVKFIGTLTDLKLPQDAVPSFFEIRNLEIYCAPSGGSIGSVHYPPGISLAGELVLFGKGISINSRFNDEGFFAKGKVDGIALGPLKVEGHRSKNAEVDLELTAARQSASIDGAFRFLDNETGVLAEVSNRGITFDFEQKFSGLLKFDIHGQSTGEMTDPAALDFKLTAELNNSINDYLDKTVSHKFRKALGNIDPDIDKAKRKLAEAERAYKALFEPAKMELDRARAEAESLLRQYNETVEEEKGKYKVIFDGAKKKLDEAKSVFDGVVEAAIKKVNQAEDAYRALVKDAEAAVARTKEIFDKAVKRAENALAEAQDRYDDAVNDLKDRLDGQNGLVDSFDERIDGLKKKIRKLKWHEKHKAVGYYAEIAVLETSKALAREVLDGIKSALRHLSDIVEFTVLENAKRALAGVQTGSENINWKTAMGTLAAVRQGPALIALETAKQALAAAKTGAEYGLWQQALHEMSVAETLGRAALTAAEEAVKNIGQTAAFAAWESADKEVQEIEQGAKAAAFASAKAILEGILQGAALLNKIAELLRSGQRDLFAVNKIELEAAFTQIVGGGSFRTEVDALILGKSLGLSLDYDVRDTSGFIDNLFKKVLEEAKKIV